NGSVEAAGLDEAIDADQATQLAALARRVEEHLGGPQDIEWAIENGAIQLLQARPITALPDPPVKPIPLEFEVPDGYWEHDASHFPTPTYPIDSIFPNMIENAVRIWVAEFGYLFDGLELREIGGWTYQRLRPIGGKEGPALPAWMMWILVRAIPAMRKRLAVARQAIASDKPGRFIDQWYDTWMPELIDGLRSLHQVDVSSLSDSELEAHIAGASDLAQRGIEIHTLLHGALAPIIFEFTMTCERLLGWDIDQTMEMVRGTSVKSTEPARRLHELAEMARHRPELLETEGTTSDELISRLAAVDTGFSAALADYVDTYAHRCLGYTLALPTIAENPALIMAMIRSQIESSYRPSVADEENARARDEAVSRARQALAGQPEGLSEFERALGRARLAYPVREDNEFYTLSAPFALVRYGVVELGDRLEQRDVIDRADDVLFLELSEAVRALRRPTDHRALVNRRKGERAWALASPGPGSYGKPSSAPTSVEFLPEDTRLPMESMIWSLESMMAIAASKTAQADGRMIEGTAASAGVYSGPVRVVMDESQFPKLRAGDVLVCPVTSPVWSVLFATIGALVTDTGGILSHPAIIAREYRVPAVVATGNATSLLEDGELVEVDGSSGTVTRLEEGITP
ncbi:MAG: PEP-utilizing enzyme, partial [Acidimicrobiia bacterium]